MLQTNCGNINLHQQTNNKYNHFPSEAERNQIIIFKTAPDLLYGVYITYGRCAQKMESCAASVTECYTNFDVLQLF